MTTPMQPTLANPQATSVTPVRRAPRVDGGGKILMLPAMLLIVIFLLGPLALIVRYSLDAYDPLELMKGIFTFETYARVFTDSFYQGVLANTAKIAAVSTLFTLLFAFPVAYFISRMQSVRMRNVMMILVVLPLLLGNAARTAAWMLIMGTKGVANSVLLATGWVEEPLTILYTPTAVAVALVSVLLPIAIITLLSVMDAIPQSLEEAAQALGCSPLGTIGKVVLPLAMPGVISAAAISFALAMNSYATPTLIGGPKLHMMGPHVYSQIAKVSNWPTGSALACILMVTTVLLTVASTRILGRKYR